MLRTEKLYLKYPYKARCDAVIEEISIENSAVRFDQTIAFPAGGGQASDSGIITIPDGSLIPFHQVYKVPGRAVILNNFPMITVDNPIYHVIPSGFIKEFSLGKESEIGRPHNCFFL